MAGILHTANFTAIIYELRQSSCSAGGRPDYILDNNAKSGLNDACAPYTALGLRARHVRSEISGDPLFRLINRPDPLCAAAKGCAKETEQKFTLRNDNFIC
jgi:hypothetical protein